jgi:hypothetical protein
MALYSLIRATSMPSAAVAHISLTPVYAVAWGPEKLAL